MDLFTIIDIIVIVLGVVFCLWGLIAASMEGGSRVKKATTAALNMDLIKSVYKKIKG